MKKNDMNDQEKAVNDQPLGPEILELIEKARELGIMKSNTFRTDWNGLHVKIHINYKYPIPNLKKLE